MDVKGQKMTFQEKWANIISEGEKEVTAGNSLENTKVLLKQIKAAEESTIKLAGSVTLTGGYSTLDDAYLLGAAIDRILDGASIGASIVALIAHLNPLLYTFEQACEKAVKEVENTF
jgi:hypothetical protein